MSNKNNDGIWILVIGAIVVAIVFLVRLFATSFGLDASASVEVIVRHAALFVISGAAWKFGEDFDPIHPKNTWPILLALFWCCWWPALDYWASQQLPSFFKHEEISIWWAAWYTKWGFFAAIVGAGYAGKKLFQHDY